MPAARQLSAARPPPPAPCRTFSDATRAAKRHAAVLLRLQLELPREAPEISLLALGGRCSVRKSRTGHSTSTSAQPQAASAAACQRGAARYLPHRMQRASIPIPLPFLSISALGVTTNATEDRVLGLSRTTASRRRGSWKPVDQQHRLLANRFPTCWASCWKKSPLQCVRTRSFRNWLLLKLSLPPSPALRYEFPHPDSD